MAKVVVAYPKFNKKDFDWIQSIRKESDILYYKVIKPHFTIVFPVFTEINNKDLVNHVKQKSKNQKPFDISLEKAVINDDAFSDYWHTFLTPKKGYQEIINLHDQLYTGLLEPELRKDIPFIPHVGIANDLNKDSMSKLVDKINQNGVKITGEIDSLNVCDFIDDKINFVDKVNFK